MKTLITFTPQHSKGPWKPDSAQVFHATTDKHIGDFWMNMADVSSNEEQANAALCAAAPEMAEYLWICFFSGVSALQCDEVPNGWDVPDKLFCNCDFSKVEILKRAYDSLLCARCLTVEEVP